MKTPERLIVPRFATEAEEAEWWDDHMDVVEADLVKAIEEGTAQRGTAQRLTREARNAKNITIRMPVNDLDRVRRMAEAKGLGCQTLMKMLLHEALDREEREAARISRS